jgi:hypothetical protein
MKWLYKATIDTGILIELEDEAKYKAQGYVDTPDDYVEAVTPEKLFIELQDMCVEDLATYAYKMFNVKLDRRKNHSNLVKEVQALEDGD